MNPVMMLIPSFFFLLLANNLWTNPNAVTVYLIYRPFHTLIPVFGTFATSLLWVCVIWSPRCGTGHMRDTRGRTLNHFACKKSNSPAISMRQNLGGESEIFGWKTKTQLFGILHKLCYTWPHLFFFLLEISLLPLLSSSTKALTFLAPAIQLDFHVTEAQGSALGTVTALLWGAFALMFACLQLLARNTRKPSFQLRTWQ